MILWEESSESLLNQGRVEEAKKVRLLFTRVEGEASSKGAQELLDILAQLRSLQKPLHIEHAMTIVLRKNGVSIPLADMMQFGKGFEVSK